MTGQHLAVKQFGINTMGVTLLGDPSKPEPELFIVRFPGGHIELSRLDSGDYWVHLGKHTQKHAYDERLSGYIVDGRIDVNGKHASESDAGDLLNPDTDHVAIRISTTPKGASQ